jgi:ligand-binding SRPBCC domain-containing protein
MKISILSPVNKNYLEVFDAFSKELFEYLAPKGQLNLLQFDGCHKGDLIKIQFLKPFKTIWISEITANGISADNAFFIDEGVTLPFGLKEWRHQHIITKTGEGSCVINDFIEYKGQNKLITLFHFIPLYLSFYQRKAKYKSYFELKLK